jgi:carboxyl-terminal processing protease
MRKRILISLAIILPLGLILAFTINNSKEQSQKELYLTDLVINSLKYLHYEHRAIDDNFSEKTFELYLKRLDYTKKFLLKEDVAKLETFRTGIDDEIRMQQQGFFNLSYKLIAKRTNEAEAYYQEILDKPFDFSKDEKIQLDDKKNDWAESPEALKESWRKALKYQVMLDIYNKMDTQEKAKEKSDTVKLKSFEELEIAARKKVRKQNKDYFRRLGQLERKDYFTLYLNSINGSYDPHTSYFPPKDKDDFDIAISGQLEGIGATLQEKDGYIKVVNIVPGSPSWKQGELKAGDFIIKVAEGEEGEPLDLIGMRLDKAVRYIRGKKGTTVRLTIKKVDGSIKEISIVRDVVVIEATYAKSVIVTIPESKKRIGYIYLPSFYVNFNKKGGGRRSADDVLKEINKLKAEGIDGMIIDLRNDGGGSLQDVVTMGGYFIETGPIVQVKQKGNPAQTLADRDPDIQYDGPLAIMVNSNSASASEIFAAAMQDYNRAVIIGGKQTFGKGTVQRFIDLDDVITDKLKSFKPFGAEKLTFQKFYRINGGATQLKGVTPDIILPDNFMYIKYGERELDNYLPWDEISPATYQAVSNQPDIKKLSKASKQRIAKNERFQLVKEQAKRIKKLRDENLMSLNYKEFSTHQKKLKLEAKKFDAISNDTNAVIVEPLQADWQFIEKDSVKLEIAKKWHRGLRKDIYLQEAIRVVEGIEN